MHGVYYYVIFEHRPYWAVGLLLKKREKSGGKIYFQKKNFEKSWDW
jgi:hypothetical protein